MAHLKKEKLILARIDQKELEKKIIETSKEETLPAKIGMILRDKEGIPKTKPMSNRKITQILIANKIPYKTEKEIISGKIEKLKQHIQKNKHDQSAKRSVNTQLWAVKRAK